MCDKTASGKGYCKPREPVKYPHLAVKYHTSNTVESTWKPKETQSGGSQLTGKRLGQKKPFHSRVQSGLPMPKKSNNNINVRQTYPIFGEVNPQRVVQLIEQFHELLPLRGREDCFSPDH